MRRKTRKRLLEIGQEISWGISFESTVTKTTKPNDQPAKQPYVEVSSYVHVIKLENLSDAGETVLCHPVPTKPPKRPCVNATPILISNSQVIGVSTYETKSSSGQSGIVIPLMSSKPVMLLISG